MQPNYAEVINLAKLAGEAILEIYNRSDFTTVVEKDDKSPLTEADLAAHRIIEDGLPAIIDIPIISEEADIPNQDERSGWDRFWLIDPLDGTKEFIDRNGEFTVNIALIEQGEPSFGLIYAPVSDECYYGGEGRAYLIQGNQHPQLLKGSNPLKQIREKGEVRLFASRRHATEQLDELCMRLQERLAPVQRINVGSALKLARLANGDGEIYPRFGNVSEWDIAAGHAILRCVGGDIRSRQFEAMSYGSKPSMVVPGFFAVSYIDFDWRPLLLS